MRSHILGILSVFPLSLYFGCSRLNYTKTVEHVDISRFMIPWYVWAGRTTYFEEGAYNAVEKYTWNEKETRIDVDFSYRKDSFDGELKKVPQKAWIDDEKTNAHWKVQPFWPLKFDYLIVALDPNYEWTAIGVPSGKYLWIMGSKPQVSDEKLAEIIKLLEKKNYPTENTERVPQKWP